MTLEEFCKLPLKEQQAFIHAKAAADGEHFSFSCRKLGDDWNVNKQLVRAVIGTAEWARRLVLTDKSDTPDCCATAPS